MEVARWIVLLRIMWTLHSTHGCGILTHIEIAHRAAAYFNTISQGLNYNQLLKLNPDALQAGAVYPDAFYDDICYQGVYHGVSEDTHWTPFINASVNYIRRQYPPPWDVWTQKLVIFLLGVVQHQVADVSWHSLEGLDQGFLETMAQVNYYGSFDRAHTAGDFGGDVLTAFEQNIGYVGVRGKWYVPVDDLVNIYTELYGQSSNVTSDVIGNCTHLLYLQRLGESIGLIDLLYPRYAENSPFLLDSLDSYFLGGIDDMATWSGNIWNQTITMLDQGTDDCYLPENPLYINCDCEASCTSPTPDEVDTQRWRHLANHVEKLSRLVDGDDVVIKAVDRGVYFSPSTQFKRRVKKWRRLRTMSSENEVVSTSSAVSTRWVDTFYDTRLDYSRLGRHLISGDVNGDGHDDVIISAPGFSSAGNYQQGRVYIIYGSSSGTPVYNLTVESSADLILEGPQRSGRFGWSVAVLDINADGQLDVAVSSPSADSTLLQYHGAVYVYLGQSAVNQPPLSSRPNLLIHCTELYCNLGWSLSSADVNSDGFIDLIIGAPFTPSDGGTQRGMIAVLFSSSALRDGQTLTEADFSWRWYGQQDFEWLGYSVSARRMSDGNTWIVAGSPTYRLCALSNCSHDTKDIQVVGQVTVFKSNNLTSPSAVITGTAQFNQLGTYVTLASYQHNDVVIASSTAADGEGVTQSGVVQLFDVINGQVDVSRPSMTFYGDKQFSRFGDNVLVYRSRSDGLDHVVVSAPYRSESVISQREAGRVYEFFGTTSRHVSATQSNVTYMIRDKVQCRLGSATTLLNSQHKQQLLIGAAHYKVDTARLAGTVAVVEL